MAHYNRKPEPTIAELEVALDSVVREVEALRDAGVDPAYRERREAERRMTRLQDQLEAAERRDVERARLNDLDARELVSRIPRR